MNTDSLFRKPPQPFIKNSTLVLLAFSILFFSRPLDILGAPDIINFAHFGLVPAVCVAALLTTRTKNRNQLTATWMVIIGLLVFFGTMLMSALVNGAGVINVFLDFLLLAEPFIMLLAVISITMSSTSIKKLRNWLVIFAFFNIVLAYYQCYVLGATNPDEIYGIFFSIAGATVSSIVSLTLAIYYFVSVNTVPIWIRILILLSAFWQILISDTKLVLGSFLIGFLLLSVSKIHYRTLIYLIAGIGLVYGLFWAMKNVEVFKAYSYWINPDNFTNTDNDFFRAKTTAIRIIPRYYESFWNVLFGLGPGHSVGRLGGWMMEKYWLLLKPLGATWPYPTMHDDIMIAAARESIKVTGTAMYGPLFSWVGIWGDLGLVGLGGYLFLWAITWRFFCHEDFSKLLVLNTFATGLFPGYLEEPGAMLFTTFLIGLRWHELREKQKIRMQKNESLVSPVLRD